MCVRFMTKRFITEYSSGEMRYNHFTFVDNEIAYFDVLDTCYKVRIFWELAWKTKIYLQESCWVKHLYCILRNFQVFSSEHVLSSSIWKYKSFWYWHVIEIWLWKFLPSIICSITNSSKVWGKTNIFKAIGKQLSLFDAYLYAWNNLNISYQFLESDNS